MIKKYITFSLILSILSFGLCLKASAATVYEDGFGYEVNTSKREATLVSYEGYEEEITIPEYFKGYPVKVISGNAFSGNKDIKSIRLSNTNTTVEEYAFMDCTSLETVYLPESTVSFGDRVFANCTSLKTVTLLSDIVSLPTNMFYGCSALKNVTINNKIAEFSYGCFNGCSSLTDLDFVTNGAMIQPYAFNGVGAESVVLSDSLFAIPNYAFTKCVNLKYVTIPQSVTLIQPYAFDFDDIMIRCYYDSYAYQYAVDNNVKYELIDGVVLGDANGDGHVSIRDVTAIQRHLTDLEKISGIYLKAAEINQDGNLNIRDATTLQMFLTEYEVPYPIGEVIFQ